MKSSLCRYYLVYGKKDILTWTFLTAQVIFKKKYSPETRETIMKPSNHKETKMSKKWQCTVCGLTEQGVVPPKTCSKCGVKSDKFIKIK